jgi:hypothetical protein
VVHFQSTIPFSIREGRLLWTQGTPRCDSDILNFVLPMRPARSCEHGDGHEQDDDYAVFNAGFHGLPESAGRCSNLNLLSMQENTKFDAQSWHKSTSSFFPVTVILAKVILESSSISLTQALQT